MIGIIKIIITQCRHSSEVLKSTLSLNACADKSWDSHVTYALSPSLDYSVTAYEWQQTMGKKATK